MKKLFKTSVNSITGVPEVGKRHEMAQSKFTAVSGVRLPEAT